MGSTQSTPAQGFPATINAFQGNLRSTIGKSNAYLLVVGANGAAPPYASYYGGTLADAGLAVAVDASGNVYATLANGQVYEYVPLGKHVVSAPGVCRGRPTFKYTRIEVAGVLSWLCAGKSADELIAGSRGRVTSEALQEAGILAARAWLRQANGTALHS